MALPFQLVGRPNFARKNMIMKCRGTDAENYMLGKSSEPGLVVELGKSKRNGRVCSSALGAHFRKEDQRSCCTIIAK